MTLTAKDKRITGQDLVVGLRMISLTTKGEAVVVAIGEKVRVLYPASGLSRWWSKSHVKKYYIKA